MLRTDAVAIALAFSLSLPWAFGQKDEAIHKSVEKALRAYSLISIRSSVQGGSVTLKGTVDSCRDRLLADEMVSRIHGVKTIQDSIQVLGPRVPDTQLKTEIDKIIADRIAKLGGSGFGSMTAQVQNGAVTLTGSAAPELAEPAIDEIAGTVGVKNVIDHVSLWHGVEPHWRPPPFHE